jgi:hypothetical protein
MPGYSAFRVLRCRGRTCTPLARLLMQRARSQVLSDVLLFEKNLHYPAISAAADAAKP